MAEGQDDRTIVVVGGYGAVGRVAALMLSAWFPGRVVVAGRDLGRAAEFARSTRGAVTARRIDVERAADVADMLEGASVVVMCVERANEAVARACLERGVHYIDVSASATVLAAIARLHPVAVRHGATAALSVGLAPGLTNLLARHCVDRLPTATHVDITVLVGLGEHHGAGAVEWTVGNLAAPAGRGGAHTAKRARVRLPEFGPRTAYPFPFSDQYTLTETLGLPVRTRLCFDSKVMTGTVFALRRAGLFALMRRLRLHTALTALFSRFHMGTDRYVVQATAYDRDGRRETCAASGRLEARATAIVTAHVARRLRHGTAPPGALHLDQLLNPVPFFAELAEGEITFHGAAAGAGAARGHRE
jgi:hypothetical protein